jgi:hypothetical protein
MRSFKLIVPLFVLLNIFIDVSYGQNFAKLPSSTDSTYGYSAYNPLKLKNGDPGESIGASKKFLKGLKTENDQELIMLGRSGVKDPNFKVPSGIFESLGKGGILDKYQFLTYETKDTITLYIDIYRKGKLKVPLGLKYVKP